MKNIICNLKNIFKNFDEFSIFILETILIIYYPYFSYHPIFSPFICFIIILNALILNFRNKNQNLASNFFIIAFSLFISFGFWNINLSAIHQTKIIFIITQIAYFYTSSILLKDKNNQIIFISVISSLIIILSLYGIWQYFIGFDNAYNYLTYNTKHISQYTSSNNIYSKLSMRILKLKRINSLFSNPNIFGCFLLLGVSIFIYKIKLFFKNFQTYSKKDKKDEYKILFIYLIPIIALLLTRSSSSILLIFFALIIVFILKKQIYKFSFIITSFILLSFSCFYLENLKYIFPSSFQSRINYWESAWAIIIKNPFFGHGIDSFKAQFLKHLAFNEEITKYAHNYFLELFSEIGIFGGFGIFILFLFYIFYPNKNTDNKHSNFINIENFKLISLKHIFIIISSIILFFPPFTIYPPIYSILFSLILNSLLFLLIIKLIYHFKNQFIISDIFKLSLQLILIHSFLNYSLDKLSLSILFFGLLGIQSTELNYKFKYLKNIKIIELLLKVLFIIGLLLTLSKSLSNYYINKSKQLLYLKKTHQVKHILNKAKLIAPYNIDILLPLKSIKLTDTLFNYKNDKKILDNNIKEFLNLTTIDPLNYNIWYTLAKYAYAYPKIKQINNIGLQAINKAIALAPTNLRLYFLKAKLLEQKNQNSKAYAIYNMILYHQNNPGFNYIFLLEKNDYKYVCEKINNGN